jgi:hypothetical protein
MPIRTPPSTRSRNSLPFRKKPQTNSKTGINGVSLTYTMGNKGRTKMPVGNVHYKLKAKEHNKRFYIHLYASLSKCMKEAIAFRKKMEKEMLKERKNESVRRKRQPA